MKTIIRKKDGVTIEGHMEMRVLDSVTGEVKRVHSQKNKIVAAAGYGVNLIMRQFGGDQTYSLDLSKSKIGTGTAAVTGTETDLAAPVTTIARTKQSPSTTSIELEFFATDNELANGTYHEFGVFTDDTRIFTRVLINTPDGFTKASLEDVMVKYTITITPS